MKIEIITHCYAGQIQGFAAALQYQISSLLISPPPCDVQLSVCYTAEDLDTESYITGFNACKMPIEFRPLEMDLHELGRRSIGRNYLAKKSEADIVWFTDVDHVFRGCLDRLIELKWPDGAVMVYPQTIQISKDHETGDKCLSQIHHGTLSPHDINPADFVPKVYRKAIGGTQIVQGDFAREYGYLDAHPKWQQPTKTPFGDFRDDVKYRKHCMELGAIQAVNLPGLFRIRHSQTSY